MVKQFEVQLQITTACNVSCVYCGQHTKNKADLQVLSLSDVDKLISMLKRNNIVTPRIVITGGEPTVHVLLNKIVAKFRKSIPGAILRLQTNLLNTQFDYDNLDIDEYYISYHSEFINSESEWFKLAHSVINRLDKPGDSAISLMYHSGNKDIIDSID